MYSEENPGTTLGFNDQLRMRGNDMPRPLQRKVRSKQLAGRPPLATTARSLTPSPTRQPDPRKGIARAIDEQAMEKVKEHAESLGWDWTYREMEDHLKREGISAGRTTIWRRVRDWIFQS